MRLVPQDNAFYEFFQAAGQNLLEGARLLSEMAQGPADKAAIAAKMRDLEHANDDVTHRLMAKLNSTFVTPFDREDIYGLAGAVDTVVDQIEAASELLDLYRIEAPMEQSLAQCRVLVEATGALAHALSRLRGFRGIDAHLAAIKRCEDEGDRIVRDAIAALFEDEDVSPRAIIRWKDIFEALEQAIDACDTAAHVLGNIVVKNA